MSASPIIDWSEPLDRMNSVFDRAVGGFNDFGDRFTASASELTSAMNNLAKLRVPDTINMKASHDVNVTLNGSEVLSRIMPEIEEMIVNAVGKQIPELDSNSGRRSTSL